MTEQEWALFAAEVEATFRGELAEDRESALRTHLERVPFESARAAIHWLVTHETIWMPTPAEMVTALKRSAGERHARAWLSGFDTPEAFELAVTRKYAELTETPAAQMPQIGRAS